MFRRLLLRLTLLNASVIAILFLLLILGGLVYANYKVNQISEQVLSRLAEEINGGFPPPFLATPRNNSTFDIDPRRPPGSGPADKPPPPVLAGLPGGPPGGPPPHEPGGHGPAVFYVQTAPDGKIAFASPHPALSEVQVQELIKLLGEYPASYGRISFANALYFYLKEPRADEAGTLYVLQDFDREFSVIKTIMNAIALIGFGCFLLSLGGSLYLAKRAMHPIQQAWDRQRDFLADASHELRTPLAVIQASLDVIRSNADEQVSEQKQWLDNMGESVASMANLVDSLLFLARLDSSQHPIHKNAFALDIAIANAADLFKTLTDTKNIYLTAAIDSDLWMLGDEGRIKQVLGILLDNAIRHTPAGGRIEIMLQQHQRHALLTVSDNGEGIAPEHLTKVFERFYQADPSRNKTGSGLGLSIAKCIIESHQGTIQAISKLGSGTTISVRLPSYNKVWDKQGNLLKPSGCLPRNNRRY